MPDKKIYKCYPIETIKSQIENSCKNITFYDSIHKEVWNKYPCPVFQVCRNDHCTGKIKFSIYTPTRDVKIITVINVKNEQRGYAYIDQQLRSLIDKKVLKDLPPEVDKELNPPLHSSS